MKCQKNLQCQDSCNWKREKKDINWNENLKIQPRANFAKTIKTLNAAQTSRAFCSKE